MKAQTDQQLLRDYAESHSEPAFAELVRRHVDLVYSAALRMVCDSHQAEDVTQNVFIALSQNAGRLADHPVLSGWLHRTTQNLAANAVRTTIRRQTREQEAAAMNELLTAESEGSWDDIAPHLDQALGELAEADRNALLLRYFERKSAREMAQTLGVSDEAAQKRVTRAVERLRESFAKLGFTFGASGLVAVISANAVQAAPVGLAATISTAAAFASTTCTTAATATTIKTLAMTTLQKTLIGTALVAAIGTGIYKARESAAGRRQAHALQEQPSQQPQRERNEDSNDLAVLRDENQRLKTTRNGSRPPQDLKQKTAQLGEPPSPEDNAADNPPPSKEIELPKDSWVDAGFGTPQEALQTRGWAVLNGNRERFKESVFVTDAARQTLEDMFVQMVEASKDPNKAQYVQEILNENFGVEEGILMPMMAEHKNNGYTGYRILSQQSPSENEMIMQLEIQMASAPAKKETLKFRRIDSDWKVVIDEEFIKMTR